MTTILCGETAVIRAIKLKKIGRSVGVILPTNLLRDLRLKANDEVLAVETADGILLKPVDPETKAALAAYHEAAKLNEAAMAALAKL